MFLIEHDDPCLWFSILNPLTSKICWAPNNSSRCQMGFNSGFKRLSLYVKLWIQTIRFVSVRLFAWNKSAPFGRIFITFDKLIFFEILSRNFKLNQNLTRIKGTLQEDQNTFLIISRSGLVRLKNISDKSCRESQNTLFVFRNFFPKIASFMR